MNEKQVIKMAKEYMLTYPKSNNTLLLNTLKEYLDGNKSLSSRYWFLREMRNIKDFNESEIYSALWYCEIAENVFLWNEKKEDVINQAEQNFIDFVESNNNFDELFDLTVKPKIAIRKFWTMIYDHCLKMGAEQQ